MSHTLSDPRVLKDDRTTQFIYETPHRIHDVKSYPFLSPNGSTIIIYGHENGITIGWRGGRPLKSSSSSGQKSKTNGANADSVMVIDSDDEQSESQQYQYEDKPEFGDEEEWTDSVQSYPKMVQHLDLDLGAAGLHIAVPYFITSAVEPATSVGPAILSDQIILAVACSDHNIRVVTIPLTPPSPESKLRSDVRSTITAGRAGTGKWGEIVVDLVAGSQSSDGVSLTFVPVATDNVLASDGGLDQNASRTHGKVWHAIVASHSRTGPGQLLIHRVPILGKSVDGKMKYSLSGDHTRPQQKISLPSPATAISFHPNISSPTHSTRLLLSDRHGACRIYDCGPSTTHPHDAADITGFGLQQGSWLLTLYSGFQQEKLDTSNPAENSPRGITSRKPILDCKWAMGGKAVIALLGDGEWGIWDIEGAMHSGMKGILGRQSIKGGAMTVFSISGWIDGPVTKSSSGRGPTSSSASKFAPMTPGTRKTAEPVLFSGKSGLSTMRGQISVTRLPPTSTTSLAEECVLFWLEDSYNVIPNLRAYLEVQARKATGGSGNLFGAGNAAGRMVRLEGVNLRGERCSGVDSFSRQTSSKPRLPADMIILGEHRYIILSDSTPEPSGLRQLVPSQTGYQTLGTKELDVAEIDQVLSRMDNSNSQSYTKGKLGFLS